MELPSTALINEKRIAKFNQSITETLENGSLDLYRDLIAKYQHETGADIEAIAAALAAMAQGGSDLLLAEKETPVARAFSDEPRRERRERSEFDEDRPRKRREERAPRELEAGMARFCIDVGYIHKVKPGNIVGAIANEANLDSKHIGHIAINDNYTTVDLPADLGADVIAHLKRARVAGRPMNLCPEAEYKPSESRPRTGGGFRGERNDRSDRGGYGEKRSYGDKPSYGEKRSYGDKPSYGEKRSYGDKPSFGEKRSYGDRSGPRDGGNRGEVNGNSVNYVPPAEPKRGGFRPKPAAGTQSTMRYPSDSNRRSYDGGFAGAPAGVRPNRPKPFKK